MPKTGIVRPVKLMPAKEIQTVSRIDPPNTARRHFLLTLATASCAGLAALPDSRALAQNAGSLPHLAEDDPLGKALGYKADAGSVDKAKFPTYKPGQTCSQCRFYQGTAGQTFGPCQVFAGKAVSDKGWCVSFSQKT
jgi:hypothetical protein